MDTTHIAYTAEDFIAHTLQKNGFLVAKPKFDQNGTDLIAFLTVKDGAKFGRIQCKGRSLITSTGTNIKIPEKYTVGAFFLFLYLDIGDDKNYLFLFFPDDIKKWTKNKKEEYCLSISKTWFSSHQTKNIIRDFSFENKKIIHIKNLIKKTPSAQEKMMWDIIKKQQKLNKISTLKNELDLLKANQKHLRKQLKLIDENQKLSNEKKAKIIKDFYNTMPPNIISYAKRLKSEKVSEADTRTSIISKFKNQHQKTGDLGLLVEIIYGKHR